MSDLAINIQGVGKQYRLGEVEPYRTFRDAIVSTAKAPVRWLRHQVAAAKPDDDRKTIWALRDINLQVKHGEVLGIIGRNGAGKSTLLKILSRITEPSTGQIDIYGRVASLLEVGTGFHPELTGRENVFLNGSILGMSRTEIRRKFDEIVDFSGVERFLDTPVKRYSSGMQVRLAFAVAAHLDPEILIIDEVLAVGDADFQKRCLGKMNDVASSGRTILFVSHNMSAVESLCTDATLLQHGRTVMSGPVRDVIDRYLDSGQQIAAEVDLRNHPGRALGATPVMNRLRILDDQGNPISGWRVGDDVSFELQLRPQQNLPDAIVVFQISGTRGERIVTLHSRFQYGRSIDLTRAATVCCTMHNSRLMPGHYHLGLIVKRISGSIDEVNGLTLEVVSSDLYGTGKVPSHLAGPLAPEVAWRVSEA